MDPFVLLVLLFLCEAAAGEGVTSVNSGDDVILSCRSADPNIAAVEWTRTDLESEYVLFYRDGLFISRNQHPFFHGRVQLVERDLKDGDVSLILKNISSSDEGTYECRVKVGDSTRQKRAIIDDQPISRVRLQVTGSDHAAKEDGEKEDGGHTDVSTPLAAVAAVLFLVCLSVVGLFVFRKYRRRLNNEPEAAAAEAESVELNMLQS